MAETKSLHEIITCAICLELLNKPVIFPCIHHFCKSCKNRLKTQEEAGVLGVLCPICTQFTNNDAIKDDFVMEQIVNVHSKNADDNEKERICEFCSKEKSTHKCLECKSDLCENCKTTHLRIPACKGHTLKPLQENEDEKVVNTVVFCAEHSDKIIEFNCVDCNKAICYRCKILNHEHHSTQTIQAAIDSIMPVIHQKLEPITNDIDLLNDKIKQLNETEAITKVKLQTLEIKIENRTKALIKKVNTDSNNLTSDYRKIYRAKMKEIEMQRSDMIHLLSSKDSIKARTETVLSHLQDVNLLLELQGDLMSTLDKQQSCGGRFAPVCPIKKDLKYVTHEDNMVAVLTEEGEDVLLLSERVERLEKDNILLRKSIENEKRENSALQNSIETEKKQNISSSNSIEKEKRENISLHKKIEAKNSENMSLRRSIGTERRENSLLRNSIETEKNKFQELVRKRNVVLSECRQQLNVVVAECKQLSQLGGRQLGGRQFNRQLVPPEDRLGGRQFNRQLVHPGDRCPRQMQPQEEKYAWFIELEEEITRLIEEKI